jgi:hypothetical protein
MKRTIVTMAVAGLALIGLPAAIPAASAASAASTAGTTTAPRIRTHLLTRAHVALPRTHLPQLKAGAAVTYSGNWSGYGALAKKGVALRYVQADWNIPSVSCPRSALGSGGEAFNSDWVGLDGLTSSTVEQTGTTTFCNGGTTPSYYAWYEMYPAAPITMSDVGPGDAIDASVYFDGTAYEIALKDVTTGGSLKVTQKCSSSSLCENSSAEVIAEDPGASAPVLGLADFGQENFTSAQVTSRNGTRGTLAASSLWTSMQIDMKNTTSGHVLATAGPLLGGQSFAEAWVRSL